MRFSFLTLCLSLLACDETPSSSTENAPETPAPFEAAAAPTSTPASSVSPDMVVASWDGGEIRYGELEEQIKNQLIQMEVEYLTNRHNTEMGALEQILVERLLEAEVAARGLESTEALLKLEVEDKVTPSTEEEIQEFYAAVQRQLRGAPLEQVRPQVEAELMRRKQAELFQAFVAELKSQRNTTTTIPYPDLPRIEIGVDDDPMLGAPDAPVTIVQFAEFQCPYCGKAGEAVDRVLEEYEGKVRMVYRDFPLSFHPRAVPAAVAANCAGEQDKYWEMHALLMGNQRALEEADLVAHAQTLSLDMDRWNTCRQDPAQEQEVMADMEAGAAVGVTGTPAFFINGIMLSGALPFEQFKEIIDRELDRG